MVLGLGVPARLLSVARTGRPCDFGGQGWEGALSERADVGTCLGELELCPPVFSQA